LKGMKPLVIIPARKGSKGVPGKNKKLLAGKPLIQYTIEAAREVFADAEICVSTDDTDIVALAENLGLKVPFLRPAELATDTSSSVDVVLHALGFYKQSGYDADVVVLLQPTSPFRTANHIREALRLYHSQLDMVVSVCASRANPYYNLFEENADGFLRKSKDGMFIRRQDCPPVWEYNGAIYIVTISSLLESGSFVLPNTVKFEMSEFASHDVDTKLDWQVAEMLCGDAMHDEI
jgi:CMP-N,N'-diacetyllegionaminic acid synthase